MTDLAKLETVIVDRFEATAIDAVIAIRNVKAFKAALVGAIASEINNITAESIACEVAAIVAAEEGSRSLIDLVLGRFRKTQTTPPRYIPVAAIAPAVEAALAAFTAEAIDLSSEWSGNTIDFEDW